MAAAPPGGTGAYTSSIPGLKLQVAAWLPLLGGTGEPGAADCVFAPRGPCTFGRGSCRAHGPRGALTPQSLDVASFALLRQTFLIAEDGDTQGAEL